MRFGIHTLDEFDFNGKTTFCRVDINQPIDREKKTLKSTARVEACVPTVRELSEKGARVVLLAHQGSDIEYENFYTTEPHAAVLSKFLDREVVFVEDVCGPVARERIKALRDGEIILLDNVRFCSEEQTLFELKLRLTHKRQAKTEVVRKLAPLADIYVCDAFAAAHRDQPTLCGFEQLLPSAMGRLFEREYCVISELMECPEHPCVFVLGGSKVADAFLVMKSVLHAGTADIVLTGGLVGQIMLAAKGEKIGQGTVNFIVKSNYGDFIESAKGILQKYGERIRLPRDLAFVSGGYRAEAVIGKIPDDICALDVGNETAEEYCGEILKAATVFVNGPVGVFEKPETELGTKTVWDALGETTAFTVIGGGDSVAATVKYGRIGDISYICTGGGALIRFLSGEELPVVKALRHATAAFPVSEIRKP